MTAGPEIPDGAHAEVHEALHTRLAACGFERVDLDTGADENGNPAVFVDLWYALMTTPIDPRDTFGLKDEIAAILQRHGETRAVLLRHHFHKDQQLAQ